MSRSTPVNGAPQTNSAFPGDSPSSPAMENSAPHFHTVPPRKPPASLRRTIPPANHGRASFDHPIRVKVFDNGAALPFPAFRGVITRASGYFARALSGRWERNNGDELGIEDHHKIFQDEIGMFCSCQPTPR